LVIEVLIRKQFGQRVLVTTLTKKMSEALTDYLNSPEKIDKLVANYQEKMVAEKERRLDSAENLETIWRQEQLPIEQMAIGAIEPKYYHHLGKTDATHLDLNNLDYPKVAYLHSDIETLERSDILDDLRRGEYDVVVGINLLREGLDLPEVSLVAILDADKAGFLRSRTSLIQTMGRGARHIEGHAILYADFLTAGIKQAVEETLRRRETQIKYNQDRDITPTSIIKPIRKRMIEKKAEEEADESDYTAGTEPIIVQLTKNEQIDLNRIEAAALTPYDRKKLAEKLRRRMGQAAKDMDFELAALLRDKIKELN